MGVLRYDGEQIRITDIALAHLKMVISTKLRRGESFTLSWVHPKGEPRGRSTIWIHPSIPFRFTFDDPEPPELDQAWLEELVHSSHSTGGIRIMSEHLEDPES